MSGRISGPARGVVAGCLAVAAVLRVADPALATTLREFEGRIAYREAQRASPGLTTLMISAS